MLLPIYLNLLVISRERVFRFLRFCAAGGTVAIVDFGSAWTLSHILAPVFAVSLGYFAAATCHFLLNKLWVFKCQRRDYLRQLTWYGLTVFTCWLTTVTVVIAVLPLVSSNIILAKLIALPPASMVAYVLMQLVVFRFRESTEPMTNSVLDPPV
jgi:putative flippase GtrA